MFRLDTKQKIEPSKSGYNKNNVMVIILESDVHLSVEY